MEKTINMFQTSSEKKFDIIIKDGVIEHLDDHIKTQNKVLIITDENVPNEYVLAIKSRFKNCFLFTTISGEGAKSFEVYQQICSYMLENSFNRSDIIIALGGGVIGDLAGFVASTYERGIDFYSVPTTTLSQIDSSIGGKTAINLNQVKNIVGSFHQPKGVFIDFNTLKTLPSRHFNNGLAEAVKAGMIYDETILELFENGELTQNLPEIIYKSLMVKKKIVEKDEKELSLRKILNFGHTVGHAVESFYHLNGVLHGEAVALGMLPMTQNEPLRHRLEAILRSLGFKTSIEYDKIKIFDLMSKDKKNKGSKTTIVIVKIPGKAELIDVDTESLINYL